jgi:hypothetical protein
MVWVAEARPSFAVRYRGGVGIGGADPEISRPPIRPTRRGTIRATSAANPIVALRRALGEFGACFVRQVDRQPRRRVASGPVRIARPVLPVAVLLLREELGEVRLNGEAGLQGVQRRIGGDLRGVDIQFLAPHQPGGEALLHDQLEETPEHVESIPLPDAAQTGVVGERLGQIVAEIPAQAEPIGDHLHELTFGAQPFEEEDELQCSLKKTTGSIEGRPVSA